MQVVGVVAVVNAVVVIFGVVKVGILLGADVDGVVPQAADEILRRDLARADRVDGREQRKLVLLGKKDHLSFMIYFYFSIIVLPPFPIHQFYMCVLPALLGFLP